MQLLIATDYIVLNQPSQYRQITVQERYSPIIKRWHATRICAGTSAGPDGWGAAVQRENSEGDNGG